MVSLVLPVELTICIVYLLHNNNRSEAIISRGFHDPLRTHDRVWGFYDWGEVSGRTEKVYSAVVKPEQKDLREKMRRYVMT